MEQKMIRPESGLLSPAEIEKATIIPPDELTWIIDEASKYANGNHEAFLEKEIELAHDVAHIQIAKAQRTKTAKEIFRAIEEHLKKYQWTEKPAYSFRHYKFCPTDFYELKKKYLGEG